MENLNKVELVGTVGSVRVQRYADSEMVRMTVATNYFYKDREGGVVVDTSWHNVVAWNVPGIERICRGTAVRVEGRLRYQKYTDVQGEERSVAEIYANKIEIVE